MYLSANQGWYLIGLKPMTNYDKFTFQIQRKVKGSRTFFFGTINNMRISKINFARKYDAQAQIRKVAEGCTAEYLTSKLSA